MRVRADLGALMDRKAAHAGVFIYRLAEPDLYPTKLFNTKTANILRRLLKSVLMKFGQAWDGDGVNVEE